MSRKKNEPTITFTEILCLAIRQLDSDIQEWEKRLKSMPPDVISAATEKMRAQREVLVSMYYIENGSAYE